MNGYLHIYTGEGKGKTTAALGLALRAAGAGMKVVFCQFIKGGGEYSEIKALKRFEDLIEVRQFGRGGFIKGSPEKRDIDLARRGLEEAGGFIQCGEYGLVILDEAVTALGIGLFSAEELKSVVCGGRNGCEVVITGRGASEELIEAADLVTEMKEIKHYFTKGVMARNGIEK